MDDLIQECAKMAEFDHPNVLKLTGVCIDGGPAPYIIMPFLTNGSLLSYLKENRASMVLDPQTVDPEDAVSRARMRKSSAWNLTLIVGTRESVLI